MHHPRNLQPTGAYHISVSDYGYRDFCHLAMAFGFQ